MTNPCAPFYPIIYVRGFAMTRGEIENTTADPFCGFNIGSTMQRAVPNKTDRPRKYVFESPLVRLATDFGYTDVYEDGYDIVDPEWTQDAMGKATDNALTNKSVIIFRYYDPGSKAFGDGKVPSIEQFATDLSKLVARVRDLVCDNKQNDTKPENFRCYLVAHSMGGLVCRSFLQNAKCDPAKVAHVVDKLFTYATPHNGIDVLGLNVPSWLGLMDISNFNRDGRMNKYLDIEKAYQRHKRVDLIPEARFSSRRVFCMVGTNRLDYEAAAGMARTFVGNGSDGLVRIENATLSGVNDDGSIGAPCAKAFAYRSHSGAFGIVNSEEAYQNLTRFLFGDVRVDIWLEIEEVRLPPPLQKEVEDGKEINALYQVELFASPRGKLWFLTRRTSEEDSVACFSQSDWKKKTPLYLSTVFLANRARVNPRRRSLAYSMMLNVRVPDYEVERRLWLNEHFEGGFLFRNALVLEIVPPRSPEEKWRMKYAWQDTGVALPTTEIPIEDPVGREVEVRLDFDSTTVKANGERVPTSPGIRGRVRFVISEWNP